MITRSFRRQPASLYYTALAVFCFTAIVPIAYMLAGFIAKLLHNPTLFAASFADSRQLLLLGRSFSLGLLATLIALTIGLPAAFILAADNLPGRKWLVFLVAIPLLIPPYIMAGAWIHLLSPGGLINTTLASIFGPDVKLTVFSLVGCGWCLGLSFFPVIAIIVATGLSQIDRNLQDVARLSTNCWGVFRHSTFIQILPHLAASICLVMIFVLGRYGVPSLLGVNTYPVEIFTQFSAFYDDNAAIAAAMPLVTLVVVLILLQRRFMRDHHYVSIAPSSESAGGVRLGKALKPAVAALMAFFVVTVVLPFLSVLANTQSLATVWRALNSAGDSIATTSILALLAAIVSTVVAWPIAHRLVYGKRHLSAVLDIICWIPIAIPATILGLGFVKLGSMVPVLRNADSFGILLLCGYIGLFTAFPIRILEASFRRADGNVVEAAMLDCQRWYQRLFHVDLPIHAGAVAASMVMVFVLVVGELNATVLLIPPGRATLAVTIDNLLHYGANANASVLCLVEAFFVVLAVAGVLFMRDFCRKRT